MKSDLSEEQITGMFEFLHKHALAMMQADGQLMGVIHAFSASGEQMVVPMVFGDTQQKEMFMAAIKELFIVRRVTSFFVVTEAWTASVAVDEKDVQRIAAQYAQEQNLQNYPGRDEAAIIQYVSYEEVRLVQYPILRDSEGNFTKFGEPQSMNTNRDEADVEGAIVDLLPSPEDLMTTNPIIH